MNGDSVFPRFSANKVRVAGCVGGSKIDMDVYHDLHNFRNTLGSIREELDSLLVNIEVGLNCVGFEGSMGLEGAAGVELKPLNAQKSLSTHIDKVNAVASLLRPFSLLKPVAVGQGVLTQLEGNGSPVSNDSH